MKDLPPVSSRTIESEVVDIDGAVDALQLGIAAQVGPRRWRRALHAIRQRIEAGETLEEAFATEARRMPAEMRSLWQQALRTDDPCGVVLRSLQDRNRQSGHRREWAAALAYPTALLVAMMLIALVFNYSLSVVVDWNRFELLMNLDRAKVVAQAQDQLAAVSSLSMFVVWLMMVVACVRWVGPPWGWLAVVGGLAQIGAPLRYAALGHLLRRIVVFMRAGVGEAEAIAAAARSLRGSELEVAAYRLQSRLECGQSLGNALAESLLADRVTRPVLRTLDHQRRDRGQALANLSNLLDRMCETQSRMIRRIAVPLLVFSVMMLMLSTLGTYFYAFLVVLIELGRLV